MPNKNDRLLIQYQRQEVPEKIPEWLLPSLESAIPSWVQLLPHEKKIEIDGLKRDPFPRTAEKTAKDVWVSIRPDGTRTWLLILPQHKSTYVWWYVGRRRSHLWRWCFPRWSLALAHSPWGRPRDRIYCLDTMIPSHRFLTAWDRYKRPIVFPFWYFHLLNWR